MLATSTYGRIAAALLTAGVLAGCAAQPQTIAADDEALCQYSATAGGATAVDPKIYAQCRGRLQGQRARTVAANAGQIQGYALLPASGQPTDVAGRCKAAGGTKDCMPPDVTGTIPSVPPKP